MSSLIFWLAKRKLAKIPTVDKDIGNKNSNGLLIRVKIDTTTLKSILAILSKAEEGLQEWITSSNSASQWIH